MNSTSASLSHQYISIQHKPIDCRTDALGLTGDVCVHSLFFCNQGQPREEEASDTRQTVVIGQTMVCEASKSLRAVLLVHNLFIPIPCNNQPTRTASAVPNTVPTPLSLRPPLRSAPNPPHSNPYTWLVAATPHHDCSLAFPASSYLHHLHPHRSVFGKPKPKLVEH